MQSGSRLAAHSTAVSDRDFNKPLGVLTQSVFIPGTQQAITANTEGSAVIWEDLTPAQEGSPIMMKINLLTSDRNHCIILYYFSLVKDFHIKIIIIINLELILGSVQLDPHKKRPLKLIRLHDCPITVLTTAAKSVDY